MTNIGCGARPARTSSASSRVSRTWLSSTARRWALNSSPSRGTLPCTAATVMAGSSPAPHRTAGRAASQRVASSTTPMHAPGSTTAGGAASGRARRAATTARPRNDCGQAESGQRHRERHQRRAAELRDRQQRPVGLAETDYAPRESAERHGRLEPFLGRPQPGEPERPAGQSPDATASKPNSAGNSACTSDSAIHGNAPTSPLIHGNSGR